MGKSKDSKTPLEKVQAENTNRAKKNYERKLKRLRHNEDLKRLKNKKESKLTEKGLGKTTND